MLYRLRQLGLVVFLQTRSGQNIASWHLRVVVL